LPLFSGNTTNFQLHLDHEHAAIAGNVQNQTVKQTKLNFATPLFTVLFKNDKDLLILLHKIKHFI